MVHGLAGLIPSAVTEILLVLFLSFLLGLEREERKSVAKEYAFGGVRTFPLLGLLGYALGALSGQQWGLVAAGLAVVGAFLWLSYRHKLETQAIAGVTTELSGIVTYVIGVLVSRIFEGGHAIEIIGYNHAAQYFIVKNSWGTGWGTTVPGSVTTPGFFLIAFSQLAQMPKVRYGGPEFGWYSIAYTGYSPDPCTYSISPNPPTVPYSGVNNAPVSVTSPTGCLWTAVSNVNWITIVSGKTGKGDGTVTYSVSENNATTSRIGTLTIAGRTFTVTQAAATCSDSSISPQSASPTYNGGTATVTVTSPSGCTWTAVSNAGWISVVSGASGTGNGTVRYSVTANSSGTSRVGTITIAGQTFTVTQAGVPPCSYSLSPNIAWACGFRG